MYGRPGSCIRHRPGAQRSSSSTRPQRLYSEKTCLRSPSKVCAELEGAAGAGGGEAGGLDSLLGSLVIGASARVQPTAAAAAPMKVEETISETVARASMSGLRATSYGDLRVTEAGSR